MNVGLPAIGVGIGTTYYILLITWMPFYEVWLTLHGRSSAPRWRRIGSHAGLAAVILAALGGELWFLDSVAPGRGMAILRFRLWPARDRSRPGSRRRLRRVGGRPVGRARVRGAGRRRPVRDHRFALRRLAALKIDQAWHTR